MYDEAHEKLVLAIDLELSTKVCVFFTSILYLVSLASLGFLGKSVPVGFQIYFM